MFLFIGTLLVYIWVTSSEDINLCVVCVADDVGAVCVSAPLLVIWLDFQRRSAAATAINARWKTLPWC